MASLTLKNTALILGSMLIGGALTAALYTRLTPTHSAAPAAEQQRKVLFWYDPMYPNTRFDKPGKSPFMDMDLVPKYADEEHAAAGAPGVRIDPTQTQNLGVKTAAVTRGPLRYAQTFPANISFNEYQYVIMQARAAGFINKVYPLTVGDKVKQGTPLLELTIPDWVEAQSEYLLLQETGGTATQVEGILERLRLAGMPDDDIRRLAAVPKLCPQFHLSLQSGSDPVLKRMNRKYDTARYYESVRLLNEYFPGCAVTTDLIVGFPGESEASFEESLAFIRKCALTKVHIFPYSRREGTPADKMPDQVPKAVKEARAARAAAVAAELEDAFHSALIGTVQEVLFEQPEDGLYAGHAPNYAKVYVRSDEALRNRTCRVRITAPCREGVLGELV